MRKVASSSSATRLVLVILGVWFALALVVSLTGGAEALFVRVLPPPVVGVLAVLALVAVFAVPRLRTWAETVPLRVLVSYHMVRFVGIAFLVLAARGALAEEWAVPAGWGDIAVAVLALVVAALACPPTTRSRWVAVTAWNAFGLADILFVLSSAVQLADPTQLAPLTQFPLNLIPLFVVPLILVTHVLIFWRLLREHPGTQTVSGG